MRSTGVQTWGTNMLNRIGSHIEMLGKVRVGIALVNGISSCVLGILEIRRIQELNSCITKSEQELTTLDVDSESVQDIATRRWEQLSDKRPCFQDMQKMQTQIQALLEKRDKCLVSRDNVQKLIRDTTVTQRAVGIKEAACIRRQRQAISSTPLKAWSSCGDFEKTQKEYKGHSMQISEYQQLLSGLESAIIQCTEMLESKTQELSQLKQSSLEQCEEQCRAEREEQNTRRQQCTDELAVCYKERLVCAGSLALRVLTIGGLVFSLPMVTVITSIAQVILVSCYELPYRETQGILSIALLI